MLGKLRVMDATPEKSWAQQTARASWLSAVIFIVILAVGGRVASRVILDLIGLLMMTIGFICGIVALFGISKHGARGIVAPASVGLLINGLLLFIFFTNFFAARERAQQAVRQGKPIVKWTAK